MNNLHINLAGIDFFNPVFPAAGTYEYGKHTQELFSSSHLGAIVNKTIFRNPRKGNPPPRIWETPSGILNSVGIPSKGLEWFIKEELPVLSSFGPPVIASIAGESIDDFCELSRNLTSDGRVAMLELDLSCPNIGHDIQWSQDEKALREVVFAVRQTTELPVLVKLTPLVSDILSLALTAQDAGADVIVLGNTIKGIAINIDTGKPALGNVFGGLSGPAIKPISLGAVYTIYPYLDIPVIGIGGITTWKDAVEYLMAGASAVGVGMYNFVNPFTIKEIIEGLKSFLSSSQYSTIEGITGAAHRN